MRSSLLAAVLSALFALDAGAAPLGAKANLVSIAVDGMNDWIGCLGVTPRALTPNIERLAARGVCFTNAHTAGVSIASTLARAAGLAAQEHLPKFEPCLYEFRALLKDKQSAASSRR